MKKLLFIIAVIACAASVKAQDFDETMLVGTWKFQSMTGYYVGSGISSFGTLKLGDMMKTNGEKYPCSGELSDITSSSNCDDLSDKMYVDDFFISNGNKLHILTNSQIALRFIIESLTDTEMKLKTFGGNELTLVKAVSVAEDVRVEAQSAANGIYNLNGTPLPEITTSGIYIVNGEKLAVTK